MIESHEEKSCRLFNQAIYIYLISCWVKSSFWIELSNQTSQFNLSSWVQLLNSTQHFFKKISTQLDTFWVEYSTWCSQSSWVRHLLNQNINSQHRWWNADIKTSKRLQFEFIIHYIHKETFNYFSLEWTTQEWLQTTSCRKLQFTSFTLREAKMLHSTYDDWYFTKHHYKCKTETTAEIRHNHLQNS